MIDSDRLRELPKCRLLFDSALLAEVSNNGISGDCLQESPSYNRFPNCDRKYLEGIFFPPDIGYKRHWYANLVCYQSTQLKTPLLLVCVTAEGEKMSSGLFDNNFFSTKFFNFLSSLVVIIY